MLLGYTISEPDNGCYMFTDFPLTECARYSNIYSLNVVNPNFVVPKKKLNITCTYDGFTIVNEKFKQFCEAAQYQGLEFVALPKSPGFYWFKIHNVLAYDTAARMTRFINYNAACNGYEEIIGATPACLTIKQPLQEGFYRSDVCFGSFAGKSPLYFVGETTKQKLRTAGFKEIHFAKIFDTYNWQKQE